MSPFLKSIRRYKEEWWCKWINFYSGRRSLLFTMITTHTKKNLETMMNTWLAVKNSSQRSKKSFIHVPKDKMNGPETLQQANNDCYTLSVFEAIQSIDNQTLCNPISISLPYESIEKRLCLEKTPIYYNTFFLAKE